MNSSAAIDFILSQLDLVSNPLLTYHTLDHTRHVLAEAKLIAFDSGVEGRELELLITAAAYHDCGFLFSTVHHEKAGIEKVEKDLPFFGFSPADIAVIARMIARTELPQSAESKLERILCDADLSYLGGPEYTQIAQTFRQELINLGRDLGDKAWLELQINFLTRHHYWTAYGKANYEPGKARVLAALVRERETMDRVNRELGF